MAKPLAGKRLYEAMGRRAASLGLPMNYKRAERAHAWPTWARVAWARGWIMQPSRRQQTEMLVAGFEADAEASGRTLCQQVNHFLARGDHA